MRSIKKIIALVLSLALTFTTGSVCFAQTPTADTPADQKVFVTFVYGGNTKGEWVVKGTNVTAPEVPVVGGSTFCGWSAPLTNIQVNQHIYAVYKPNYIGDAAIEAAKKALPTPAISATKAADPNAVALATPVALSANGATNAAQMQLLMAMLAQQQAAGTTAPAAQTAAATTAAPAAAPAATTPTAASTTKVTTPAAETTTAAAPAAAAVGVINFTDKDGNAGTFTQKEWNTLLNVYGGSEAVLRKHSLGDLKKVAAYYGG